MRNGLEASIGGAFGGFWMGMETIDKAMAVVQCWRCLKSQQRNTAMLEPQVNTIHVSNSCDKDSLEFLSDLSAKDRPWDIHKELAGQFSDALGDARLARPAARVHDCATALFFAMEHSNLGEVKLKLRSAPFCHYRHCPICQWRRSLKSKAIIMTALPAILEQYPTARFALLTLTVRNCEIETLRETIQKMNQGWKRLIKRVDWPAIGWIRSVEVTRGSDDSAHPHYHILLMLPSSYFHHGYIPTREWVQRWRESMRLDYDPICDIRQVKPKKSIDASEDIAKKRSAAVVSAVSEVAKYSTKTTDLLQAGPDWLRAFVKQVHGLKFLTSGGALKNILKSVKEDDEKEDLIHVGEGEAEPDAGPKLRFGWRQTHSRYARKI
jgi:plasmid rolling circle replication initiator protein Rep